MTNPEWRARRTVRQIGPPIGTNPSPDLERAAMINGFGDRWTSGSFRMSRMVDARDIVSKITNCIRLHENCGARASAPRGAPNGCSGQIRKAQGGIAEAQPFAC